MKLSYKDIMEEVCKRISQPTFNKICEFTKGNQVTLWGSQQDRNFLKKMIALVLYKDMKSIGYHQLIQMVSMASLSIPNHSATMPGS